MNPQGLIQQPNIEGMSPQIKDKLNSLRQIPNELVGKIPETVWASLTADHRAEMLKQYGIYEKYLQLELRAQQNLIQNLNVSEKVISTEVPLDQLNIIQPRQVAQNTQQKPLIVDATKISQIEGKSQFADAVEEKNRIEANNIGPEQSLPRSEKQESISSTNEKAPIKRMQMENPQNVIDNRKLQPVEKVVPKFSGYPVSEDIPQNVNEIEEHGSPRDGSTWTASLIKKIWAIFTN